MQLLQVFLYPDIRRVVLDFLHPDEIVLMFCSCVYLRMPFLEEIQGIKQCYLSWIKSSGIDTRLLQILACPLTRNAVLDFLYDRELILTFLSCRTLKMGFLDDVEDIKKCWLRWWDMRRDKWLEERAKMKIAPQVSNGSSGRGFGLLQIQRSDLILGPLGTQTATSEGASLEGYLHRL